MFVAVYVDDVILTGTDTNEINQLKVYLDNSSKIKDLSRLHYFLGLEYLTQQMEFLFHRESLSWIY